MKAIIVDDEPRAIDLLAGYLKYFNSIELAATFRNGLKAFEYISKTPVDLIFLDINMPHISGISISRMLPKNISIIFTTAYSEYAVESYEVEAVDYLLKPISLERFTKAVSRVLAAQEITDTNTQNRITVKSGFETFRVTLDDILYLEKDGNYITYYCENEKILARETIQEALDKLPQTFLQTHKSYIVNTEKIHRFDRNYIYTGNQKISISDTFREMVLDFLEK